MAIGESGSMVGSVSGGCVETAVVERALNILSGGEPTLESYGLADEHDLGVGLPCGSVDVLVETLPSGPAWQAVVDALRERAPYVSAAVLDPPAWRGRRMSLADASDREPGALPCATTPQLRRTGSIDPSVDDAVAELLEEYTSLERSEVVELETAGSALRLFVNAASAPESLFIIGATDIAAQLAALADRAGFRVFVIDPRSAFADARRFPEDVELVRLRPEHALEDDAAVAGSMVVTLSHDAKFDLPALQRALAAGAEYVGALGSRRTHAQRCEMLRAAGVSEAEIEKIHAPVGLDIGATGPYEIAVSVLAELIAHRARTREKR